MLDYKHIEALATVVMEGGFERAARKLRLTQSAVSQRVKQLEEQSGQILLIRTTPPKATAAGQRVLKHYLQVQRLEEDLLDDFSAVPGEDFAVLPIGINDDSLATWFLEAVSLFLQAEKVLLDLRTDDQEQTQRLLKIGKVVGCISSNKQPIQGCRVDYLGTMNYRLLSTPAYAEKWFPQGLSPESVVRAPAILFSRKDELQAKLFRRIFPDPPSKIPTHYFPSSEKFVDFITLGLAYGMLPDVQSKPLLKSGRLIELAPAGPVPIKLYWHCWNLKSRLLNRFTTNLVKQAKSVLDA